MDYGALYRTEFASHEATKRILAARTEAAAKDRDRIAELETALRHIELLAFTGTQTAVTRGDDDGQRRAAFFRDIRDTARGALNPSDGKRGCPCDDGDGEGCPAHGIGAP